MEEAEEVEDEEEKEEVEEVKEVEEEEEEVEEEEDKEEEEVGEATGWFIFGREAPVYMPTGRRPVYFRCLRLRSHKSNPAK